MIRLARTVRFVRPRTTGKLDRPVSVRDSALCCSRCCSAPAPRSPACGEDEAPAPTTPGAALGPGPTGSPSGLSQPRTTSGSPVRARTTSNGPGMRSPDALAYQGHSSARTDRFTTADATFLIGAPRTSYRVEDLADNTSGTLPGPVRRGALVDEPCNSVNGAGLSWARPSAPTVVPLNTPQNLRATDPDEDSVTLRWDRVSGAGSYDVEQREPEGEQRVGRRRPVKAFGPEPVWWKARSVSPADWSRARTTSSASERFLPTRAGTGRAPGALSEETRTEAVRAPSRRSRRPAGWAVLDVRWTSDADGIMWTWDRLPGATYDYAIVTGS